MTSPVSPSETIAKAMEGLRHAPGPWEVESEKQDDLSPKHDEFALHNADGYRMCGTENADWRFSEIVTDGPDEDGFFSDWNDPAERLMKYIAACNPVAMREVLDELYALRETALQQEAMQREMAEKDKRIAALEAGLKPFVNAFERRREAYSKRYGDRQELGYANFDKMPDAWDMETISFTMGAFRRARALIQGDEKCTAI